MPSGIEGVVQPMHQLLLVAIGTPIFDNCDLEALGDVAAKRNRWVFRADRGRPKIDDIGNVFVLVDAAHMNTGDKRPLGAGQLSCCRRRRSWDRSGR
jgi:hypothetical protein